MYFLTINVSFYCTYRYSSCDFKSLPHGWGGIPNAYRLFGAIFLYSTENGLIYLVLIVASLPGMDAMN
ncbi:Uncharacterised protein [Yersinia nurmii]|uniref:Uncharacterized protein n=1 Tax=Yersinia nurmii TaxID=685706 RepID=A0ABM9S7J1_9GAMM|nr:Uncharacterised protein [Yersinia nurmii]